MFSEVSIRQLAMSAHKKTLTKIGSIIGRPKLPICQKMTFELKYDYHWVEPRFWASSHNYERMWDGTFDGRKSHDPRINLTCDRVPSPIYASRISGGLCARKSFGGSLHSLSVDAILPPASLRRTFFADLLSVTAHETGHYIHYLVNDYFFDFMLNGLRHESYNEKIDTVDRIVLETVAELSTLLSRPEDRILGSNRLCDLRTCNFSQHLANEIITKYPAMIPVAFTSPPNKFLFVFASIFEENRDIYSSYFKEPCACIFR